MTSKSKFSPLSFIVLAILVTISALAVRFVGAIQKDPVKRVVAYRRFHPNGVQPPIFIHDLEVKGQKRKLSVIGGTRESSSRKVEADDEFDEDDNTFVEHIRFKVTNRSDKAIKFVRFIIHFYTNEGLIRGGFDTALWVEYGHLPMPKDDPSETPLMPGKKVTISTDSVPEIALVRLREDLAKLNADIVRAGIVINTVTFQDGSEWYYDGQTRQAGKISLQKSPSHTNIGRCTQLPMSLRLLPQGDSAACVRLRFALP